MENINDTLLVTINLSALSLDESTVEVVTYLGQYRDVINVFRGKEAELIYKALMNVNKRQLNAYLEQLLKRNESDPAQTIIEDLDVSEIENLSERKGIEDLEWKYANPAIGKVTKKYINGETVYVVDEFPQEDNNDRSFEEPEIEVRAAM